MLRRSWLEGLICRCSSKGLLPSRWALMVDLCSGNFHSVQEMILIGFARDLGVAVVKFDHSFEFLLRGGFPLFKNRLFYF